MATEALIRDQQVDLWLVFCGRAADPRTLAECRALLAAEELAQERRFLRPEDQVQFVLSRTLLRTALSAYTDVDPRDWSFVRSAYGKPSIAAPAGVSLQFNVSHSSGLAACAVTRRCAVGVDVEDSRRDADCLALARRYFHPTETAVLESLSPEQHPAAFFRFWTLKEAFLKAHGTGLSIPPGDVAFSLAPDRPPAVSFGGTVADDPKAWQFAQIGLAARYQVALAVRAGVGQGLEIRLREGLPLHEVPPAQTLPASRPNAWVL